MPHLVLLKMVPVLTLSGRGTCCSESDLAISSSQPLKEFFRLDISNLHCRILVMRPVALDLVYVEYLSHRHLQDYAQFPESLCLSTIIAAGPWHIEMLAFCIGCDRASSSSSKYSSNVAGVEPASWTVLIFHVKLECASAIYALNLCLTRYQYPYVPEIFRWVES